MKSTEILEYLAPVAVLLALFLALGICLTGCLGGASPATEAGQALHAAVTSSGTAASVATAASKTSDTLRIFGTLAILAGAVACAVPVAPNGLGLGLIGGGLLSVLAGILLPAYAGTIGIGLTVAAGLFYLGRLRSEHVQNATSAASGWLGGVLSPLTKLLKPAQPQ